MYAMCTTRDEIREIVHEEMYASHNAVASSISAFGLELQKLTQWFKARDITEKEYQKKVDEHLAQKQLTHDQLEKLITIVEEYTESEVLKKSMGKLKNMVIGFAAFCGAIGTIIFFWAEFIKRLMK